MTDAWVTSTMRERASLGMPAARVEDWGVIPYREAWERQKRLRDSRIAGEASDTLVFCEHSPSVVTLGRGAQRGERPVILDPNIEVIEIERGGLATWHGPGQMVVYPVYKLDKVQGFGVLALIRSLEEWVIRYLRSLNLEADAVEGKTGVWIAGERKIASIGIAVSHWVSYHGLSLNFATGREPWRVFNPCGFSPDVMTDLTLETGRAWSYEEVREGLLQAR
jgi:lipoyl(octanoyl) transferase